MPERSKWAGIEAAALGLVGAAMVLAGTLVNGDRAHLAVTLVALGVLLIVRAAVLPRLQSFSAKLPGLGEISASLMPPSTSVSDGALAPAGHPELDLRGASPHTSN